MARLIQKTGFISRKSAGGYMKYIATREGVEVLTGKGPTTEKQKELVAKLLKDFPDMRDSFEYEDYKQAPTLHTASALISAALDSHMQNLQSENGYNGTPVQPQRNVMGAARRDPRRGADPWSGSQPPLFEIAHWLGK